MLLDPKNIKEETLMNFKGGEGELILILLDLHVLSHWFYDSDCWLFMQMSFNSSCRCPSMYCL